MKVNVDIKALLKQRRFKWKTLKNETSTGQRIEVLEGLNLEYKEQLSVDTAFIYRRGLVKADFQRNTLTFDLTTQPSSDAGDKACISLPALIGSCVLSDPDLRNKLKDCEDNISHIREFLEKDREPFFKQIMQSVSSISNNFILFRRANSNAKLDWALCTLAATRIINTCA